MSNRDSLGDRMKAYENVTRAHLMRRTPVIIRIDGKAFHTFTKGFQKPFDNIMMKTMQDTMKYLCENIQGCVLGYTQSDEISLLLVDYQTTASDAWFGDVVQKMCSVSASMATLAFNKYFRTNFNRWGHENIPDFWGRGSWDEVTPTIKEQMDAYFSSCDEAMFDSRVFNIPREDVVNYFVWRQQDAIRNSIQSIGQANFSHSQLMNKSCEQIVDMLFTEKGINWGDYGIPCMRGVCCRKQMVEVPCSGGQNKTVMRNKWVIDLEIPTFSLFRDYIEKLLY